ncbi:hypothetical protein [Megasphaera sp.]|uniref:hypothetical protein n=1 Tax=Megasphaera sp. TaxID=2023260 RepID=UPI003520CDF2
MEGNGDRFVIHLKINGREIVFSNVVWNTKTGQYIGYDSTGDNIIVCRIRPKHYDIVIMTNKAISAYTEEET